MSTPDKKIAIICCTNDSLLFEECSWYIRRLHIPDGFSVEVIPVRGAVSMCSGYNQGMRSSDAKYKLYMHQDAFLVNPFFLDNLLLLFEEHPEAGMIGMVGSPRLPDIGVMWRGDRTGESCYMDEQELPQEHVEAHHPVVEVSCIDGFLMATQVDIPWREDLFDGWDFYDISQSFEIRRAGYKVLIPKQQLGTWCIHDDGRFLSLSRYDHYREVFLHEYGAEIDRYATASASVSEKNEQLTDEAYVQKLRQEMESASTIQEEIDSFLQRIAESLQEADLSVFLKVSEELMGESARAVLSSSPDLIHISQIAASMKSEMELGLPVFIADANNYSEFREKVLRLIFYLRRIEYGSSQEVKEEAFQYLINRRISAYSVAAILYGVNSLLGHRQMLLLSVAENAMQTRDLVRAYQHLSVIRNPSPEIEELKEELHRALQQL